MRKAGNRCARIAAVLGIGLDAAQRALSEDGAATQESLEVLSHTVRRRRLKWGDGAIRLEHNPYERVLV